MVKKWFLKSGNTNVFLVFFIFVFIIITTLSVEWYRIYTIKEYVDTEMSRAVNIAVDTAMLDEFRMDHISKIDLAVAKNEFKEYLSTEMKLNSSYERFQDGKFQYRLIIKDEALTETPAKYEVRGIISIRPALVGNLVNINIDIPFKQTSRNQRFES